MAIESLPTFTKFGRQHWEIIPADIRQRLLPNFWCGHCHHETAITNFSGTIKGGACCCWANALEVVGGVHRRDIIRRHGSQLADLGFSNADFRDPDYALFVRKMSQHRRFRKPTLTPEKQADQDASTTIHNGSENLRALFLV